MSKKARYPASRISGTTLHLSGLMASTNMNTYLIHSILEETLAGSDVVGGVEDAVVHSKPGHQHQRNYLYQRHAFTIFPAELSEIQFQWRS